MRNDIYQKLIEHVTKRQWVDATEVFRSVLEQKVALRLESEKQLLQEPDEDEDEPVKEEDDKEKETHKCKSCGKTFTPSYGEYARCKSCFDKQTDAGERASAGRY